MLKGEYLKILLHVVRPLRGFCRHIVMRRTPETQAMQKASLTIIVCLQLILSGPSIALAETTTVEKMRTGFHDNPSFTRVVFDLKGDRPSRLSPSPDEYVIQFQQLQSHIKPEYTIRQRPTSISSIKVISDEAGPRIVLSFMKKDSLASPTFLPSEPRRNNSYRLIVDVFEPPVNKADGDGQVPAAGGPPSATQDQNPKQEPAGRPKTIEAEQAAAPEIELPEPLKTARSKLKEGDYQTAYSLYAQFLDHPSTNKEELSAALYGLADSYYFTNKDDLQNNADEIRNRYSKALTAFPSAPEAPWALYRCSRAYEAIGNTSRALDYQQQVVQKYPKHPAAAPSWVGVAKNLLQKKNYLDALHALRQALDGHLEKDDNIRATWLLGECLYFIGQHAKAIDAFERCLHDAPKFYLEQPLILKYLAESLFVEKEYNKSRDYLFWYLNMTPGAEDKDLILARISEILLAQDDQALANKLHDYIQAHYPNSDGDVICKIRKAEYMEHKDKNNQDEAMNIYRELCQKSLSAQLARLVRFKFAVWHHNHHNFEEGLKIIDEVLHTAGNKTPLEDFVTLRKKIVIDWARSAFEEKNYAQVIRLYEGHTNIFTEDGSQDLQTLIAESYGMLKVSANAVALLQPIMDKANGLKKDEILLKMAFYSFLGGEPSKAMEYSDRVQATSLQHDKILLQGRIYFAQKNYPKVIECYSNLQGKSKTPVVLDNEWQGMYGESLMHLGQYDKALVPIQKTLDELKKADPQSEGLIHFYLAESTCYRGLKNNEKAIAALGEAASIAKSEESRNQLTYEISNLYLEMGQKEKAAQKLTELSKSSLAFWQTAAKQQLGYIQLQKN